MQPTRCPKCDGVMERGFVPDNTDQKYALSAWIAGEPQRAFWTGIKLDKKALIPIVTLRCRRCGFLESYAPPPAPG